VIEADPAELRFRVAGHGGGIVEGRRAHPLQPDLLDIDIDGDELRLDREPFGFDQQIAQFVHHALPVPRQIGRALARTRGGIDVGGDRAGGLRRA
jgi:hypothetical protein